jgi:hypothetical protein
LPLGELEFDPADRRTRYFDFPVRFTVSQLRITVQDVTHGSNAANNAAVYLPPMQVYGEHTDIPAIPPVIPSLAQTFQPVSGNVVLIEQDGEPFAIPT